MSPKEMWRTEFLLLRAIFAFLKIVENTRTLLRTYGIKTSTKNAKKNLVFVIGILITPMNGKEILIRITGLCCIKYVKKIRNPLKSTNTLQANASSRLSSLLIGKLKIAKGD
jgi:hypothetical protein